MGQDNLGTYLPRHLWFEPSLLRERKFHLASVAYLCFAPLLAKWPVSPVTWHGQLVECGPFFTSPLRCYCADRALCSHVDLQIVRVVFPLSTPATFSPCLVQPAIVRVKFAPVARGGHVAVSDPTRVLNADWKAQSWKNERAAKNGTLITTCHLFKI